MGTFQVQEQEKKDLGKLDVIYVIYKRVKSNRHFGIKIDVQCNHWLDRDW